MSFFKKLLNGPDLSPEELAEKERIREEKRIQREAANQARENGMRIEKERLAARKEKFIGTNPSMFAKMDYSNYKKPIAYIDENMLNPNEKVLAMIEAEYDKSEKKELKGILVATDRKLIFASFGFNKEYTEVFEYKKMNGISFKRDGFAEKQLVIDYCRGTRKFDDINDTKEFREFMDKIKKQIALHKSGTDTETLQVSVSSEPVKDKYEQLEQLGKLKEQGILSEEEFNIEKTKILNN